MNQSWFAVIASEGSEFGRGEVMLTYDTPREPARNARFPQQAGFL